MLQALYKIWQASSAVLQLPVSFEVSMQIPYRSACAAWVRNMLRKSFEVRHADLSQPLTYAYFCCHRRLHQVL